MKTIANYIVGLGLLSSSSLLGICGSDYRPGHSLTASRYLAITEEFHSAETQGRHAASALKKLNDELDRELAPALVELFSNPCTKVFYGDFTDPHERIVGKYSQLKDDAAGLRVIWQLEIDVNQNPSGSPDRRLISAIAFWDYDAKKKALYPLSGPDSLRLRVETERFQKKGMPALSYETHVDQTGRIHTILPGVYINQSGEEIHLGVTVWARTDHCNSCHGRERNKYSKDYIALPYTQMPGFRDFIGYLDGKGISVDEIEAVKKKLLLPRTSLLPAGFLETARARSPR